MRQTGFDSIEAVTPFLQGDVSLHEVKEAFRDDVFLIDGIANLLFNREYPVEELIDQVKEAIELFAPNLILGISDEMPSDGLTKRVVLVQKLVEEHNAQIDACSVHAEQTLEVMPAEQIKKPGSMFGECHLFP